MSNYTFLNLAFDEFENLSRDLLQKHLTMHLESFTTGKDGGIDFRGLDNADNRIIVQCKRLENLALLLSTLKKELPKVKDLNPNRYILTTSVGLTPGNKKQISDMFGAVLSEADIFGRDDLNNLLVKYPEIERSHYKLWLASVGILQGILHSKVKSQADFEQDQLEKISRVYVMNGSYDKAAEILKKEQFVILSGNPGVGKSTLARVLAYEFIRNDYQLIVAVQSISEVLDLYSEADDQVIFFDDFLGRNFLENRYPMNEEHQLINLIERVAASKNKVLILTTREYILNQAKHKYEVIKSADIDIAKCIVDVSSYTRFIKAKILYNHLYFASIPTNHLIAFVNSRAYVQLIEHPNYNPRIIETIIKKKDWNKVKPEEFGEILVGYFDKPYSVWESVFEQEINDISRLLLLVLVTTGTPITKDDARSALEHLVTGFPQKYNYTLNDFTFTKSIKELHDAFITTLVDKNGEVALEFQNPSIYDFLVDFLRKNDNFQKDIIATAPFFNQLFEVFSTEPIIEDADYLGTKQILLNGKILSVVKEKIYKDFDIMMFSSITRIHSDDNSFRWSPYGYQIYKKLHLILTNKLHTDQSMYDFIADRFRHNALPKNIGGWERDTYMSVLKELHKHVEEPAESLMNEFISPIFYGFDLRYFRRFKEIYDFEYEQFISSAPTFKEKIENIIKNEITTADEENYQQTVETLESISRHFSVNADDELEKMRQLADGYNEYIESRIDKMDLTEHYDDNQDDASKEDERIFDLFNTLTGS